MNVVEYRPEMGMRPVPIATPNAEAKSERKKGFDNIEDDITKFFDPSKGLHKAKSIRGL